MNREASVPRGRVRGRLVQNESTFQSDLSRLKTLTLARARRWGQKNLSRKKTLGACPQAGREGNRNLVVAILQDQSSCRGHDFRGTEAVLHCSACLLGSTNAALLSDEEISQTVVHPSQPPDG